MLQPPPQQLPLAVFASAYDKLRPYQRELLEQACLQDGIVTLPTGAGKTMIAATLAARQLHLHPDKWVFFVVNRTPLVDQQTDALQGVLTDEVEVIGVQGGRKSVNTFEKIKRIRNAKAVVIIDTILQAWILKSPSILTRHASLVIFDEAHHCTGGCYQKLMDGIHKLCPRRHTYNLSPNSKMTEQHLYTLGAERSGAFQLLSEPEDDESVLPKILCLSASPATDMTRIEKRVVKLLNDTQCRLLTTQREATNMKQWVLTPTMLSINFYPREEEGVLRRCFLEVVKVCFKILKKASLHFNDTKNLSTSLHKIVLQSPVFSTECAKHRVTFTTTVLSKYGHSPEDRAVVSLCEKCLQLMQVMGECLVALEDSSIDAAADVFRRVYASATGAPPCDDAFFSNALITPLVRQVRGVFDLYAARGLCGAAGQSSSTRITLLMKVLEDVWRSMSSSSPSSPLSDSSSAAHSSQFRGIIFVSTRTGAETVMRFTQKDAALYEKYRPALFVGQATTGSNSGMTRCEQSATLKRFREGEHLLLVATTVAEEGIDVPNCNVVIQFDPVYNLRSIVQSRGRARKADSLFITFTNTQYARSRLSQITLGITNQDEMIVQKAHAQTVALKAGLEVVQRDNAETVWDCNAIRLTLWLEDTYRVTVQVLEELEVVNGTCTTKVTALVSFPPIAAAHATEGECSNRSLITKTATGNRKNARRKALALLCQTAHELGYFPPGNIHVFLQLLKEESRSSAALAKDAALAPIHNKVDNDDDADEVGDSTTRGIVLPVYRIAAHHILCTPRSRSAVDILDDLIDNDKHGRIISRLDESPALYNSGNLLFNVLKAELLRRKWPRVSLRSSEPTFDGITCLHVSLSGEVRRTEKQLEEACERYAMHDTVISPNIHVVWDPIPDGNSAHHHHHGGDGRYAVSVEAVGANAVGIACLVFLQLMGAAVVLCEDAVLHRAMVAQSMVPDEWTPRVILADNGGL